MRTLLLGTLFVLCTGCAGEGFYNQPYTRVPDAGMLAIHIDSRDTSNWIDVYVRENRTEALMVAYAGPERDLLDLVTVPPRDSYLQVSAVNADGMQICGYLGEGRTYWPLGDVDVRSNFGPVNIEMNCIPPQGDVQLWALELSWWDESDE